jgi:hypothetical protein
MGKQRQKRKSSKRRTNPLERKGIEAGLKQGTAQLAVPTAEQVLPVVERVHVESPLCIFEFSKLIQIFDSFLQRIQPNELGQPLVFRI